MPEYHVRGADPNTGQAKSFPITAKNEADAYDRAAKKGVLVEALSLVEPEVSIPTTTGRPRPRQQPPAYGLLQLVGLIYTVVGVLASLLGGYTLVQGEGLVAIGAIPLISIGIASLAVGQVLLVLRDIAQHTWLSAHNA